MCLYDINYHSENLCSVAQIEKTFSGRYFIRETLNRILRKTVLVIAEAQRPYYEASLTSLSQIPAELEDLRIDKDLFSLSFNYYSKENNDKFIEVFLEIWFEYEQPAFAFFITGQESNVYRNLALHRRMSWKEITDLSPCFVLFRGTEENVMWIGKSNNLDFGEAMM
jgi:hypothetical protein